ncbi:Engulfment and cell motility domain-containing protein [Trypanosoma cruzi]|uniref:ELMO domain-containing protein n=2 Tax=Trypanosoma cruzi TaxID=5693 RepID=Q4DN25_TRYCC|nr:hypothetical protein, conserved [Trypanosoma cruzi]EAN93931.1 hypothetical protein, conserved [Trypanosoma cruzi]PWV05662.1 Engulfment and cell motility domain-containing protein [Trypanosoma cruzi]RNC45446.1 engulfment and cell motility ELM family protein [Trypanosoma cruzi]|eukprot:XP_815782.1 hypothetical protein [Trypanosoma cruzi strain CL Brener]
MTPLLHSLADHVSLFTMAVAMGGIAVFIYHAHRGGKLGKLLPSSCRGRRSPVLNGVVAGQQPEMATRKAIHHIMRGEIATLGELVYFFRGVGNEKKIFIDPVLLSYLQRLLAADTPPDAIPPELQDAHLRKMLCQLCHCSEQATRLKMERATSFDAENPEHMRLLRELWAAAGKLPADFSHRSDKWVEFGFQGLDPATDFRGGGVLALRQFLHFAQTHNAEFKEMMTFNKRAIAAGEDSWYLLAVVSIQFTAQLLLQQDHTFYLPQLEVLYDTIRREDEDNEKKLGVTVRHVGDARAEVMERSCGNKEKGDTGGGNRSKAVRTPWSEKSDFEAGFYLLHHQLLLHFKTCWHRDLPHVMEYGKYMPTVFRSFFVQA